MTTDQKEASMSQEQQPEFVALIQQGIPLDQRVVSTGTDEAAIQSQAVAAATKLNSEQQGFGAAWTAVVLSVGSQEQQPEQSNSEDRDYDWKFVILVFGKGDGPSLDSMLAAEKAACVILDGDRTRARMAEWHESSFVQKEQT